ncbi:hypothetical protein [Paraburkholderia solisilvae]|uniref:Uncharacterized protein n=1 Tax=Paraburkholderia solisilvae TaxID=624376 RepID=A0A6J5EWH8_9BURK|nr:hypothetical protein [Paraburkholderia solisilvae]CAB3769395.1 hypothetical protein LMG29739_05533 [Paraburkholderia solisilvae]
MQPVHSTSAPLPADLASDALPAVPSQEATREGLTKLADAVEQLSEEPVDRSQVDKASRQASAFVSTGEWPTHMEAGPLSLAPHGPDVGSSASLPTTLAVLPTHHPATASPVARASAIALASAEALGVPGADTMVRATSIIAEHAREVEAGRSPDLRATFGKLKRALESGASALTANRFNGSAATLAASVTNVTLRNTASVFVPTFARQMLSAQIERGIAASGMSDASRATLGGVFAALPMLLLLGGAVQAHRNRNATPEAKREGDIARLIMGAMSFSALLGGIFSGQLASKTSGATAQMIAFTLYTFMRDIMTQSHIRLKNPNMDNRPADARPVPDKLHWALISAIYGVDQFAVNQLMPTAAPVSGPGAFHAHAGAASQAKAAAIRAGINLVGEIAEDLSFNGIAAVRDKKMLRLGLNWEPSGRHVANGMLAPWAVRTAITQTNVVFGDVIDSALGNNHPLMSNLLPAITMGGLLNGIFYWPFANAGKGLPQAGGSHQLETPDVDLGAG